MAGHSKWANIKHKKGKQDEIRQKLFQKLSKEISTAIRIGKSTDPSVNFKLKTAIDKAKSNNVPNSNIEKLLSSKINKDSNSQEIVYEGYGISGVAILINCVTDNINRTSSFVKSTLSKNGGKLGTGGSVSFLFKRKGVIILEREDNNISDDKVNEILSLEIEDINVDEQMVIIETTNSNLLKVKEELIKLNVSKFLSINDELIPESTIDLEESEFEKIEKIVNILETSDDVDEVSTNAILINN